MRKMLLTVRWPGTRMAPIGSTWACRQVRWRKSGAKHRITAAKRAGRRSMAAVLWLGRPRLSRRPKVLQQALQPEPLRGHASLAAGLLWRQRQEPFSCIVGQSVDGLGLPIGRHEAFELAPKLIHWAQFGCLLGQPQEPDAQLSG